jgi:hypothetical protein
MRRGSRNHRGVHVTAVIASAGNPTRLPVSPGCACAKGDEADDLVPRRLAASPPRPICDIEGTDIPPAKSLAVQGVDRLPVGWDRLMHMPQGALQEDARGRIALAEFLEMLSCGSEIP